MSLDDRELSSKIREHATRHAAPGSLRAAIRTQVALAEAGRSDATGSRRPALPAWSWLRWRTAAAGFAAGAACAVLVTLGVQRLDVGAQPIDVALVSDHVRALLVGPLTEVASSDRHTVKPWFQGRLDYAPPVYDFAPEGFPLLGGRVERVHGKAVSTLAYSRSRHIIDVFVWPSDAPSPVAGSVHRGFNVVHWADGSMQYWAVSDLERAEMDQFAKLWQERTASR